MLRQAPNSWKTMEVIKEHFKTLSNYQLDTLTNQIEAELHNREINKWLERTCECYDYQNPCYRCRRLYKLGYSQMDHPNKGEEEEDFYC